jgi:hypothetical protein
MCYRTNNIKQIELLYAYAYVYRGRGFFLFFSFFVFSSFPSAAAAACCTGVRQYGNCAAVELAGQLG